MISTKFFHECDPFLDGATQRNIGVTGHFDSSPVDPHYLVHRAEELGYHPQVILAGRAINDSMPAHVAGMMIRGLNEAGNAMKGSTVFDQTFVKSLRVRNALRVGSFA